MAAEPTDQLGRNGYVVAGFTEDGVQSKVDSVLSITTYTVASTTIVQMPGSGSALAGLIELRSGTPYQFTAAQAAALTAAGVTLVGPA